MSEERAVFDPGIMNFTPNGGDVAAVVYAGTFRVDPPEVA